MVSRRNAPRNSNISFRWRRIGSNWTFAKQKGKTRRQLTLRETDFIRRGLVDPPDWRATALSNTMISKFDRQPFRVNCQCGKAATCFEFPNNNPSPDFWCDVCASQRAECNNANSTIGSSYRDLFIAFPGSSAKDRNRRDQALKSLVEAKRFLGYKTIKKSLKFIP